MWAGRNDCAGEHSSHVYGKGSGSKAQWGRVKLDRAILMEDSVVR